MNHYPYEALYIHLPFCVSKCEYCDFCSEAIESASPVIDEYVEDLILQIRRLAKEGELAHIGTIYIGGGTPTHLGSKRLTELLYALSTSVHFKDGYELTIEANPESIDERLIKDIWALGANRISIGVQSFDDAVLKMLGRAHDSKQAAEAISCARERFDNVSIDLMCGLPGQTFESFLSDIEQAISLGVEHVSIYPLTIEEGTPFARRVRKGEMELPDEDLQAEMMLAAQDALEAAGFSRYEVASYAKPGHECRHNEAYWTGKPYLGFGRSAVTMTQNASRRMRVQDGHVIDDLDEHQMAAEDAMLGMRMVDGLSDESICCFARLLPQIFDVLDALKASGLVHHESSRWKPTEKGWLFGNELYGALFDLAP